MNSNETEKVNEPTTTHTLSDVDDEIPMGAQEALNVLSRRLGIPEDAPDGFKVALIAMGPLTRQRTLQKLARDKLSERQYNQIIHEYATPEAAKKIYDNYVKELPNVKAWIDRRTARDAAQSSDQLPADVAGQDAQSGG